MDWVRSGSVCSIKFDWFGNPTHTKLGVRYGSIAEFSQSNPIHGLSSIEFDLLCWEKLIQSELVFIVNSTATYAIFQRRPDVYFWQPYTFFW